MVGFQINFNIKVKSASIFLFVKLIHKIQWVTLVKLFSSK
jgi:hypothetical protein